jgi:hypothetical protein
MSGGGKVRICVSWVCRKAPGSNRIFMDEGQFGQTWIPRQTRSVVIAACNRAACMRPLRAPPDPVVTTPGAQLRWPLLRRRRRCCELEQVRGGSAAPGPPCAPWSAAGCGPWLGAHVTSPKAGVYAESVRKTRLGSVATRVGTRAPDGILDATCTSVPRASLRTMARPARSYVACSGARQVLARVGNHGLSWRMFEVNVTMGCGCGDQ